MRKLLVLFAIIMITGCVPKALYNWGNYDSYVYSYVKSPNEESLNALMKECDALISNCGSRNVPPPGLCADYGFLLLKNGKTDQGKAMLNKEIELYPESKVFLERIIKRISK